MYELCDAAAAAQALLAGARHGGAVRGPGLPEVPAQAGRGPGRGHREDQGVPGEAEPQVGDRGPQWSGTPGTEFPDQAGAPHTVSHYEGIENVPYWDPLDTINISMTS